MKKLNSKLFLAAAGLGLAVASTVGSTYAWFSANTTATAKGMSINAQASSSLLIKGASDSGFSSVGTHTVESTSLKPCTSYDAVTFGDLSNGVKVESEGSAAATWTGTSGAFQSSDLTKIADASLSSYVATGTYWIKNIGADSGVKVSSVTVDAGKDKANGISPSVRVAVIIDYGTEGSADNKIKIFKPDTTAVCTKVGKYASSTWTLETPSYEDMSTTASFGKLTAGTQYTLTIKVWFEGQDSSCYSSAITTNNLSITVNFAQA